MMISPSDVLKSYASHLFEKVPGHECLALVAQKIVNFVSLFLALISSVFKEKIVAPEELRPYQEPKTAFQRISERDSTITQRLLTGLPASVVRANLELDAFFMEDEGTCRSDKLSFEELLKKDDTFLEQDHNYIQFLFPITTRSIAGPTDTSPALVSAGSWNRLRESNLAQERFLRGFERMLSFYGLGQQQDGTIIRGANWQERSQNWIVTHKHNYQRLARILLSLNLMGYPDKAKNLLAILVDISNNEGRGEIPENTVDFWKWRARGHDEKPPSHQILESLPSL